MVDQFQRYLYENCSYGEDIFSFEWTKEIFINYIDPALIKRVEDKHEALGRLEQGGITYLKIALDDMFNMSDVFITLIQ